MRFHIWFINNRLLPNATDITKWDRSLLPNALAFLLQNVTVLFQIATVIIDMRQYTYSMSQLRSVICPYKNKVSTNSWAAMQFKFQWQKVKDDCLGPGLISMLPRHYKKILIFSEKSISASTIWKTFVKKWNVEKKIK